MSEECLFCRIAAGEIPSDIVYQDEEFLAFRDIKPLAPTHILVIPRKHISSLAQLAGQQQELMGRLITLATRVAEKGGIADRGYRLVMNCGDEGGQVIGHLHLHLLGGRKLYDQLG
jgi:histidine triad (HIT) family protein